MDYEGSYEEKWDKLIEFIHNYKEAVELIDISSIDKDGKFKRGELSSLDAILYKVRKLEK